MILPEAHLAMEVVHIDADIRFEFSFQYHPFGLDSRRTLGDPHARCTCSRRWCHCCGTRSWLFLPRPRASSCAALALFDTPHPPSPLPSCSVPFSLFRQRSAILQAAASVRPASHFSLAKKSAAFRSPRAFHT